MMTPKKREQAEFTSILAVRRLRANEDSQNFRQSSKHKRPPDDRTKNSTFCWRQLPQRKGNLFMQFMQMSASKIGVALVVGLITVSGCSKKKSAVAQSPKYSYAVNSESCKTQHSATTKEELCEALRDEELNKGCATQLREQKFYENGCAGEFEQKIQLDLNPQMPGTSSESKPTQPISTTKAPEPQIRTQEEIDAKFPAPNIDTEDPNPHTIENELRPTYPRELDPSISTSPQAQQDAAGDYGREQPSSSTYIISYKYTESLNGSSCTTGTRKAYSKEEYCAILLDESLNNECALTKRQADFKNAGCEQQ